MVEISGGGLDYTNPDALSPKYPGEFDSFKDPREAVKIALEIAELWHVDDPTSDIQVGYGSTGGMTMPFDESTEIEIIKWAEERYKELLKCPQCGEIMPDNKEEIWWHELFEEGFCSEYCAEKNYRMCKAGEI